MRETPEEHLDVAHIVVGTPDFPLQNFALDGQFMAMWLQICEASSLVTLLPRIEPISKIYGKLLYIAVRAADQTF